MPGHQGEILVEQNEEENGRVYKSVFGMIASESRASKPTGLLQPLEIPMWKWDEIAMELVKGLLRAPMGQDAISIVVDWLMKLAHFIPIKEIFLA